MVECFYRQLLAALTMKQNKTNWLENLPLALLLIRNIVKEDLGGTPAEMVFSTSLTLPGQYCDDNTNISPTTTFVQELKHRMSSLTFIPTQKANKNIYLPNDIYTCTYGEYIQRLNQVQSGQLQRPLKKQKPACTSTSPRRNQREKGVW